MHMVLQLFAMKMAVMQIFVELGNLLKFLRLWPWSMVDMFQTRIRTQNTVQISS